MHALTLHLAQERELRTTAAGLRMAVGEARDIVDKRANELRDQLMAVTEVDNSIKQLEREIEEYWTSDPRVRNTEPLHRVPPCPLTPPHTGQSLNSLRSNVAAPSSMPCGACASLCAWTGSRSVGRLNCVHWRVGAERLTTHRDLTLARCLCSYALLLHRSRICCATSATLWAPCSCSPTLTGATLACWWRTTTRTPRTYGAGPRLPVSVAIMLSLYRLFSRQSVARHGHPTALLTPYNLRIKYEVEEGVWDVYELAKVRPAATVASSVDVAAGSQPPAPSTNLLDAWSHGVRAAN